MSGLYIKNINLPTIHEGQMVIRIEPSGIANVQWSGTVGSEYTKAVEVPDHDRLIDAKSISEKIDNIWDGRPLSTLGCEILAMIEKEPAVIEADI